MVLDVGVLNATRLAQSPNGANQFVEMGNPSDPTAFRGLLAMDAYQLLASATAMPASLLSIGLNDNRVAPWHSAKFVARARDRLPATRILLQVDEDAGHGIGTGEEAARESLADFMTFAWDAETRAAP
jgi:prolyl oligopeptidase